MPDMSDQELDKLFQEAAAGINPKFDPEDWERLASRLDGGDKTGFAREVSLYSVAALLMLSSFLPGHHQLQTTQTDRPSPIAELHTKKDISKDTSPGFSTSQADQTATSEAATSSTHANDSRSLRSSLRGRLNSNKVEEARNSLEKQLDGKTISDNSTSRKGPVPAGSLEGDERKARRQEDGDDNDEKNIHSVTPTEDHPIATEQTFERKDDPANVIVLPERDKLQALRKKQNDGNSQEEIVLQKKENDSLTRSDGESSADNTNQNDERVAATDTHVKDDRSKVVGAIDPTLDLSVLKTLPEQERDQEDVMKGAQRNVSPPATSDSLVAENDSAKVLVVVRVPVDSASGQKIVPEEKDSTVRAQWFVKLPVAPDFTSIDYEMPGKPGINIGLMVEFIPKKRLGISAGAIWSRKLYSKENPPATYGSASRKVRLLDGDCRVLDIPINLTYYWPVGASRTSFFATAGFSSYIMLEERYEFTVAGSTRDYIYREDISHKNNEWFSILNLSIGVQRQVGERLWLQAEPFLKAPLSGIGEGKVDLVSSGAFFTLKYRFRK